jgi:hypothetical protein
MGISNSAKMIELPLQKNKSFFQHSAASLFVWGIWMLMFAAAIGFVWQYGSNVPSWDDWDMVPTMTGYQPVTAD